MTTACDALDNSGAAAGFVCAARYALMLKNGTVYACLARRSLIALLLLVALTIPAFSGGLAFGHGREPIPVVVDGHAASFAVEPTIGSDHVWRAPVDFIRAFGGRYIVDASSKTIRIIGCDGRNVSVSYVRDGDCCMVDVKQVAESLGADIHWDENHAMLTLRAKVVRVYEAGGKIDVDTSYPVAYSTGALSNPPRIYIDLTGAVLPEPRSNTSIMADGVTDMRSYQVDLNSARIVLDMSHIARLSDDAGGKSRNIRVTLVALPDQLQSSVLPARATNAITSGIGAQANGLNSPAVVTPSRPFTVTGISAQTGADGRLRVVITTAGRATRPPHLIRIGKTSDHPDRIAMDLPCAVMALPSGAASGSLNVSDPVVNDIRWGTTQLSDSSFARVVLDLRSAAGFAVTAVPKPNGDGTVYTIAPDSGDAERAIPDQPSGAIAADTVESPAAPAAANASGSLKNVIVVVDPGHGGKDGGAPGVGGIWEKNLTLAIGMHLRDDLIAEGANVIMTREDDTFVPLPDRSQMGIDNHADLYVSIHCDGGPSHNAREGSTVYYHGNDAASKMLALSIAAKIKEGRYGITSDGVKSDYVRFPGVGFSVLRLSPEPAVLCECGYVNDDDDARQLVNPDTQKAIAAAIVAGLRDYVRGEATRSR